MKEKFGGDRWSKENQVHPKAMDKREDKKEIKEVIGREWRQRVGGNVEETGWETINTAHQDAAGSDWGQSN